MLRTYSGMPAIIQRRSSGKFAKQLAAYEETRLQLMQPGQ